jgi:hypothetical protein
VGIGHLLDWFSDPRPVGPGSGFYFNRRIELQATFSF